MVVNNPDIFTHISNFRKKPATLELENHYGQLGEIRDVDNLACRSPANSTQKKFKPTSEPCQDTDHVSLAGMAAIFQGQDPSWLLHSFPQ